MSVNTKMTALADEVRELSGAAGLLGIDAMTSNLGEVNDEISSQANILEQIQIALEDKIAGNENVSEDPEILARLNAVNGADATAMAVAVNNTEMLVWTQADLIAQIQTALIGKGA